jgi:hypothetical protein
MLAIRYIPRGTGGVKRSLPAKKQSRKNKMPAENDAISTIFLHFSNMGSGLSKNLEKA